MTGNTVLLAIALIEGKAADAARSGVALGGFCLGVAAGVALIRSDDLPWPRRARGAVGVELVALVAWLVLWAALGLSPLRYALIAIGGVAMGAQSAAVRASDVRGVNTTYMTSTLLNAIAGLVQRGRGNAASEAPRLPGAAWVTYGIGALIGVLTVRSWHAGAVAIPLGVVAVVAAPVLQRI